MPRFYLLCIHTCARVIRTYVHNAYMYIYIYIYIYIFFFLKYENSRSLMISYQSLLLSTIILNDIYIIYIYVHTYIHTYILVLMIITFSNI